MNILYDHQIFQAQRFGGISRYFYELISRISSHDEDPEVSLFLGLFINEYGLESLSGQMAHFFGKRRPEIPKTGRFFGHINQILLNRFAKRTGATLYHPTYYASPLAGHRGARVVTVYDMIHEIFPDLFPSKDQTSALKRRAVDRADRIIAISHSTKKDLVRLWGVPEGKIDVIHLANALVVTKEEGRASLCDGPYFLFVAGRSGYKNFSLLLNAYASSEQLKKEFKLVSFGGGPLTLSEQKEIERLRLKGRVIHFSGKDTDLVGLYSGAVALVYPSAYEGFGLPLLEAMKYGCPVICSSTSSIPEVAGDAACYFEVGESESLAEKMIRVANQTEFRQNFIQKGQEQEKLFSWSRCAEETLSCYKRV